MPAAIDDGLIIPAQAGEWEMPAAYGPPGDHYALRTDDLRRRRGRDPAREELVSTEPQRAAFLPMYSRTTGGGLMGLAVVLVVIGAIMRFAVTVTTSGFNIHKVGDILLLVGIILAIVSVALMVMSSRRRVTARTEIRGTPTGEERVQERQDWGGDPY